MFEKETKFITDFITIKLKSTGSGITFEKLLGSDIHPAVLKYISSEIDYLIYEDRNTLIKNSVFDYSGAEIAKHFFLIGEEIKKSKKISLEDLKKLIVQAVSFNLNFVTRPKWSLIKLIFNEEQSKKVEEIELLLNHIYYYNYLKNIILAYAAKRKLESLSVVEFELIMNKIDKELFSVQGTKLIENALWSISEFINYGSNLGNKIPLQPVEIFLKEKDQIDYLFRLRRALPIEGSKRYEIDDIKNIIFSTAPIDKPILAFETPDEAKTEEHFFIEEKSKPEEDDEINIQQEEKPDILEEEDESAVSEITESAEPEKINYSDEEVEEYNITIPEEDDILKIYDEELRSLEDLEKQLSFDAEEVKDTELYEFEEESDANEVKQIQNELLGSDEFQVTGEKADIPVDSKERLDHIANGEKDIKPAKEKEKQKFNFFRKKDPEPEPQEKGKRDIFTFFTNKEMDRIVYAVFNEDREDFVTTMEKISECSSYDDATEIVKGVFLTYRINPYSRDAVALTNAVANYFNQGK